MPTDYHDSPALPGFLKPALSPVRARCRGGEGWTLTLESCDRIAGRALASSLELANPDQRVREAQVSRLLEELERFDGVRFDVLIAPRQLLGHPVEGFS